MFLWKYSDSKESSLIRPVFFHPTIKFSQPFFFGRLVLSIRVVQTGNIYCLFISESLFVLDSISGDLKRMFITISFKKFNFSLL